MEKDIHEYEKRLSSLIRHINESAIGEANKKLLLDFDRAMLLLEGLGKPRRIKLLENMFILARRYFKGDLRKVTTDDIKDCIRDIETKAKSPWTTAGFKVTIKKFYRWLEYGDREAMTKESPDSVSWIKIHVKKKDQHRIQASDILTEDEAHRIIAAADNPRDTAFVAMLYELGARISEIGNLCVGDVTRDQYSYLVDLTGKTGHRTPRIVMSDPYLTEWIDRHPMNTNPSAPLWVCPDRKGGYKKMMYAALRAVVLRIRKKAGIARRLYPHLFRHSRVTHLLMNRQLNEAQAKVYFGWSPDSTMLSEYSHLVSKDVNDTILQIHGVKVVDKPERKDAKICPRCKRINAMEARFCILCSSILDAEEAFRQDQEKGRTDQLLNLILSDERIQQIVVAKLSSLDNAKLKELS